VRKRNKLICGWGINDADYEVTIHSNINGKSVISFVCPYYRDWTDMVRRCFDIKLHERHPTYKNCTISEEWKYFSNFKSWVDSQPNKDWQSCTPDKDLLIIGNKHYSPKTVVYIHRSVNTFITDAKSSRGNLMLGVSLTDNIGKPYRARCNNPLTRKLENIGVFQTEIEAHLAWKLYKHNIAVQLSLSQPDERVSSCLKNRYSLENDWSCL
jgi:hypothetical protein